MAEALEQTVQSKDPLKCTGKDSFPFLQCIWERWHYFSGEKELTGNITLSCPSAYWQRYLLRAGTLDSSLLLYFTLNSKLLCIGATPLLHQPQHSKTLPKRTSAVCTMSSHKAWSLKLSQPAWFNTQLYCAARQTNGPNTDRVKAGI